jgi:hypothetical protein
MSWTLLALTALGSALGAVIGAWLMTAKLNRRQVRLVIGIALYAVAIQMIRKLVAYYSGHGGL